MLNGLSLKGAVCARSVLLDDDRTRCEDTSHRILKCVPQPNVHSSCAASLMAVCGRRFVSVLVIVVFAAGGGCFGAAGDACSFRLSIGVLGSRLSAADSSFEMRKASLLRKRLGCCGGTRSAAVAEAARRGLEAIVCDELTFVVDACDGVLVAGERLVDLKPGGRGVRVRQPRVQPCAAAAEPRVCRAARRRE